MKTWQLNITGMVQGVGFRPHLFLVAKKNNFKVHVYNNGIGVKVLFNATSDIASRIVQCIITDIPKKAVIDSYEFFEIDEILVQENQIFQEQSAINTVMITPDLAWCESCRMEFQHLQNRRYNFCFIACTDCGPRFSIWKKMPFERECTSMDTFVMCDDCQKEYFGFEFNKRFFSQLNSCATCNFTSRLENCQETSTVKQLDIISDHIKKGEIVAVKGIAGYLFILDYKNTKTIFNLRKLKNRPSKPFAIMAKDLDWVINNFKISKQEINEISSSVAPIVLLSPKENFLSNGSLDSICGTSKKVGVMICSSAFLYQICHHNNGAVIATSGNISGLPIEFKDENAISHLKKYTPFIWSYNREIIFPQDDSLVQFSPYFNTKIILRRGRGMAPSEVHLPKYFFKHTILAFGAELKSTFAIGYDKQLLVSQYLGKLNNVENLDRFQLVVKNMLKLTQAKPEIILIDEHPQFNYRRLLVEDTTYKNCRVVEVQHHIAHLAAVMGENNLFAEHNDLLGVVFDGAGYSKENKILGGELFFVRNNIIFRKNQMPFFHYLNGDKMAIEPRLCYFSVANGNIHSMFQDKFSQMELNNFGSLLHKQIKTNSVGRVFDAFAFCLGFEPKTQSFEGEAAMFLNPFFEKGLQKLGIEFNESYFIEKELNWERIFLKINEDIHNKHSKIYISLKFLLTFVHYTIQMAKDNNISKMALSGGVFQNTILVDLFQYHCHKNNILLYLHRFLSPNDENISYGQMMAYLHLKK